MKKKIVLASIMFAFGMCIIPNVYAQSPDSIQNGEELKTCLEGGEGSVCTLAQNIVDLETYITITGNVTINLNNHNITRDQGTVLYVNGGKLTLTGNGTVKSSENESASVWIKDGTLDVKGNAKIENAANGFALVGESSIINISENAIIENSGTGTGISIKGENSALNISGGTVNADGDAITLFGDKPTVKITNGNITSQNGFAISGNGSTDPETNTRNSTINISGGKLTSANQAAIYNPQTGTVDITGGSTTGKIGIVARQGTVTVTGGTITATGEGSDNKLALPNGVAVIIDNETPGYEGGAKATIGGSAIIKATNENPVLAYSDDDNENNSIIVNAGVQFTGSKPKDVYLSEDLIVDESGNVIKEQIKVSLHYTGDNMGGDLTTTVDKGSIITKEDLESIFATDLEVLNQLGYQLVGYYADEDYATEFDFGKRLDDDVDIYLKIVKKPVDNEQIIPVENVVKDTTTDEIVENPDTSDSNVYGLFLTFMTSGSGLIYLMRRR